MDYRPRTRPRSINQTQNPGTGPGFSEISISSIYILTFFSLFDHWAGRAA